MKRNRKAILTLLLCSALLAVILTAGCTKNVKVNEVVPPPPIEKETGEKKPIPEKPQVQPELDFKSIPLKITSIINLDESFNPYNSYNPKFSPDERYIAVEVNRITNNTILIYKINLDFNDEKISLKPAMIREIGIRQNAGNESIETLLEGDVGESFNYEFCWFPNSRNFIFTSNAGVGEYNLFLGSIVDNDPLLKSLSAFFPNGGIDEYLMITEGIKKDGQAKISPDGNKIVFTSGRTGNGDLYLLNLKTGSLRRLTSSDDTDLYPRWSPDGKSIVFTRGNKYSHDIYIIRDVDTEDERIEVLVKWFFDDVLPSFSPDGRYISFYSTYNLERDPFNTKRWGLMIIPSDGSSPKAGKGLEKFFCIPNVIKDNSQGTAWFPDSVHIIYAKNIDSDYNPIYIYNIKTKKSVLVNTGTNINHDLTVSKHGLVSFRAQSFGWDRIFIARTSFFDTYINQLYGNRSINEVVSTENKD